jgi:hypothetical protein
MMVKDDIRHHSYLNIAGQAVVGEAIACGFSFLPLCGLVGSSFGTSNPTAPDIFGGLSIGAYVIGTATGLYWVAKAQNNSLSYWKVTEYSLIGAGVGATILGLSSIQHPTIPEGHVAVALLCPLISAMIYTNCVAEWPK